MASVGGWTYSEAMHKFMHRPDDRLKMAKSCVDLVLQYPEIFDGLDIDLEYPCPKGAGVCGPGIPESADDPANFTALIQQFRSLMPARLLLALATSANPQVIPGLQFAPLNQLVDHYNIMTYDFVSGSFGDAVTGHQSRVMKSHSPLSANANVDPSVASLTPSLGWFLSVEEAVAAYIRQGADPKKLMVGVAMYGRGFKIQGGAGIFRKS